MSMRGSDDNGFGTVTSVNYVPVDLRRIDPIGTEVAYRMVTNPDTWPAGKAWLAVKRYGGFPSGSGVMLKVVEHGVVREAVEPVVIHLAGQQGVVEYETVTAMLAEGWTVD